jgi:hypothetical protein
MGYFSLGEFAPVEVAGAWRLPQLPLNVGVSLEKGGTIEDALKRARHDIIDLPADAGKQGKACRFAALRASPEVVDARRKERRDKAKKTGKTPCAKGLVRDGWHLMLSNLPTGLKDAGKLATIYRARWAAEIQLRAWKQILFDPDPRHVCRDKRTRKFPVETGMMALT